MLDMLKKRVRSFGMKIEKPIFIKDYEDSNKVIFQLEELKTIIKDPKIIKNIDWDIKCIEAGDAGEKNVHYELINSRLPMLCFHNLRLKHKGYEAQMDFVLLTPRFVCILETKRLNGDITINSEGDFIRHFKSTSGKVYKKEGMYSPISQNERHVELLKEFLIDHGLINQCPVKSIVVIANHKSIINMKYAKKNIKNKIIKYDQLKRKLEECYKDDTIVDLPVLHLNEMADKILENHIEAESTFVSKYNNSIDSTIIETHYIDNKETDKKQKKAVVVKEAPEAYKRANKVDKKEIKQTKDLEKALKEFRLNKSREENVKAYMVFSNKQMEDLISKKPKSKEELLIVNGFGKVKVEKYGDDILRIIKGDNL